jgi:SpoVK/Ycf46/Vps4 family AAA+-type ATPase
MLRKGRFDQLFFVDLPTLADRADILRIHIRRAGRDDRDFDVDRLASTAINFSGAELESVIADALYKGFYAGREPSTQDILDAIRDTVPIHTTMKEVIDRLRTWASGRATPAGGAQAPKKHAKSRYDKLLN